VIYGHTDATLQTLAAVSDVTDTRVVP